MSEAALAAVKRQVQQRKEIRPAAMADSSETSTNDQDAQSFASGQVARGYP